MGVFGGVKCVCLKFGFVAGAAKSACLLASV